MLTTGSAVGGLRGMGRGVGGLERDKRGGERPEAKESVFTGGSRTLAGVSRTST